MSIEARSHQFGVVFGHWQIKETLGHGSGGRSMVFRLCREDSPWENCALKVISLIEERGAFETMSPWRQQEYQTAVASCKENAAQEVRLMADLRGKTNIVDYLDHSFVNWSDASGYGCDMLIRMELLKDLRGSIRQGQMFSETEAIKIGRDICQALMLCHHRNILHRDIKPENIFISADGDYKLGDFGISRMMDAAPMSMASTSIGTPEYAAPEQVTGHYDMRVDIYSLGLVLYELTNENRLPFAASTYVRAEEVQKRQMGVPLPPPSRASAALWNVIGKACAYKPEDRYQTAEEFALALESISTAEQVHTAGRMPQSTYETMLAQKTETACNQTQYAGAYNQTQPAAKASAAPEKAVDEPRKKSALGIVSILLALAFFLICLTATIWALRTEETASGTAETITQTTTEPTQTTTEPNQATTEPTTLPPTEPPVTNQSIMSKAVVAGGRMHTAIMRSDGTAIAAGENKDGQCNVFLWNGLTAIASGDFHTVGLLRNGRVVATGSNTYGQCNVTGWTDVTVIAAGDYHTVALREDGTLMATGWNSYQQCNVDRIYTAAGGKEIIYVAAGYEHTVVLCADGTVAAVGRNDYGQCNVQGWTDIIAIYTGTDHTVGLRSDGTVVATGQNKDGQCNVQGWQNVAYMTAGDFFTIGITKDGRILSTGQNSHGQLNLYGWQNIIAIGGGSEHLAAIAEDGQILAAGWNENGQCNIAWYSYS